MPLDEDWMKYPKEAERKYPEEEIYDKTTDHLEKATK